MEVAIADDRPDLAPQISGDDIVVERLTSQGDLLEAGYELFRRVFDPAVLDPKEVYVDRMSPLGMSQRDLQPCFAIAYADCEKTRLVAGFISADLMWIDGRPKDAFLAIGNIATSPLLKANGIRGIGGKLLDFATTIAKSEAARDGRRLLCMTAEAEPASLGFWKKRGFLWPVGCQYLQPPLEFLDDGTPRYPEVSETLLLSPIDMSPDSVSPELVRGIILAIYENWCLRGWRGELSPDAMRKAEDYVMGHVLGKVSKTLPSTIMPLSDQIPTAR